MAAAITDHRQQDHLVESHPYSPFPTELLEAAVGAVPLGAYPERERKLAQFGREFVYFSAGGAASSRQSSSSSSRETAAEQRATAAMRAAPGTDGADGGGGGGGAGVGSLPVRPPKQPMPLQGWMRECLSFAAAYPRVADPGAMRQCNQLVRREVLRLRPYMQPIVPPAHRNLPDAGAGGSQVRALLVHCMDWQPGQGQGLQGGSERRAQQRHQVLQRQRQLGQRSLLHTLGSASGSSSRSGRMHGGAGNTTTTMAATSMRGQARPVVGARAGLLQGCCRRLLGTLSLLRML